MNNVSPCCKKIKIAQAPKAQEPQDIKATRHETHMSMLDLKHLKQVKDEEQKKHVGNEARALREHARRNTLEPRENVRYKTREAREHVKHESV